MTEENTVLASGQSQNGGNIMPTLTFQRQLVIKCMDITIGTYPGDIGSHIWACKMPQIVQDNLQKVLN